MSTYIRMNEVQIISSLRLLQERIDERCGNTISLEQAIVFLEEVVYTIDFNPTESLIEFIDNFLDKIGMEKYDGR